MKNHWIWWMLTGILSLVGGFLAFANPFAATLTAELLAGWAFVIVGILTLFSAFGEKSGGSRIVNIFLGIIIAILGVQLLLNPLQGTVSLTLAVGVLLVFAGVCRIGVAFRNLQGSFRWAMVLSGLLSLLLAVMIFTNFPQSAVVVLGMFLAIELISNGISLIALSLARKNAA